jgi:hypothetical protein
MGQASDRRDTTAANELRFRTTRSIRRPHGLMFDGNACPFNLHLIRFINKNMKCICP